MSRVAKFLLVTLLMLSVFSSLLIADESFIPRQLGDNEKIVEGMIIVQFKEYAIPAYQKVFGGEELAFGNNSIDALNEKFGASRAEQVFAGVSEDKRSADLNLPGFYAIYLEPGTDVMQAVLEYGKNEYVIMAEPNYIYEFRDVPNDPLMATDQYWLDQTSDLDMDAPEAWTYESGSEDIIVAVDDSGVLWYHPDLIGHIWQNLGEDLDGDGRTLEGYVFDPDDVNGVDDDGNGLADDFIGYDWCNVSSSYVCSGEDYGTWDNDPKDFSGHGTNIAGLISGVTNNGIGISGVAGGFSPKFPGVRIMCLRSGYLANDCLSGSVDSYAAVQGMNYAVNKGAHVLNISFGPIYSDPCSPGYGYNATTRAAIINALNNDLVVAISAGNDDVDCPDYMALIPGVLVVAATDQYDAKAWFSSYGDWVHLSAAGVDMMSTESESYTAAYAAWNGTSYSSPVVAGVAALIRSHDPSLSYDSVNNILLNTCDPLSDPTLGAGRVNAYSAIISMPTAHFTTASELDTFPPFNVVFTDNSPTSGITDWSWNFGDGGTSDDQNPTHQYTQTGIYDVSLTIESPIGNHTFTYPNLVFAVGDSLILENVNEVQVGDTIEVHFSLKNTENISEIKIPFFYNQGASMLDWLGYSVHLDGTRCSDWEKATVIGIGTNRGYLHLRADNNGDLTPGPLAPGEGDICYVKFKVKSTGTSYITSAASWQSYIATGQYFSYTPYFIQGMITSNAACQGRCGDANNDDVVNVSDAVKVINYIFIGGDSPQPVLACGDANSDGVVNVSDAVRIINYIFIGGYAPGDCAPGAAAWGGNNCCEF